MNNHEVKRINAFIVLITGTIAVAFSPILIIQWIGAPTGEEKCGNLGYACIRAWNNSVNVSKIVGIFCMFGGFVMIGLAAREFIPKSTMSFLGSQNKEKDA